MKKIAMFFAALVVAVASFAAPATTPTKNDLADFYEPGQLCVCVYFEEEVCNDIVFAGSYNGWNTGDPANMAKFAPLEGFEGWYYVAVTDESEEIAGKPVQLMGNGSFSWDYQTGDPASWTILSGTVNISAGYAGEADLKGYSTAEPVIMISAYFKNHNTPCGYVAEYKDYTIRLNAPFCAGEDGTYYNPAIIGDFNGWAEGVPSDEIDEETFEYVFVLKNAEKTKAFKFRAYEGQTWDNEILLPDLDEEGNIKLNEDGTEKWYGNPSITLGDETTIVLDYSAGRYTLCAEDTPPTSDIPTQADLAPYYEPGQLCVCIKFEEEVCNDIVFAGSYNGWVTDPAEMAHFAPLDGFEGWYYVAVTDESESIEGKPVQLMGNGSFSWDYQTGDPASWTILSGTVNISAGYAGEADLKGYSTAEPVILISAYFKNHNSPCIAEVYHDYTIRLTAPFCADAEGNYFDAAIIGSFNGWSEGVAGEIDEETFDYIFKFNDKEGGEFKFRALGDTDWSNQIQLQNEEGEWYDNPSIKLTAETEVHIDYSAGKFTLCVDDGEYDGQCGDNLYWSYQNNTLTISGFGEMYNECRWSWFADEIQTVVLPNGITHIGDDAFSRCSALTSITIPNSVTSIGSYAFENCSALTSITIPNSVTSIGSSAFSRCSALTSMVVENGNTTYDSRENCNAIIETATNTLIAGFQNTIIPNSVTGIGGAAFSGCSSLTSITIPNSVTSIGDAAFSGCSSLTSITIPNSVTSIGDAAFWGCRSLTSVTIPNSVTRIGNYAFDDCSSLTSITWNAENCSDFTGYDYAPFYDTRSQITKFVLGDKVQHIPAYLCYGMNTQTSITIPNSVTSIGDYAFSDCSSLTSITIPNKVTSIGDYAFMYCSSLTSVTCEATTPPTVGEGAFWVSYSIPVYVPCGTVSAYNAAGGWSSFYNIQEPLAEYSIQVSPSNSSMGTAQVDKHNACGCNISATPNYGYHFMQWSDGNTDNPRSLELTRDTVLTAEFAPNNYTLSVQSDNSECGTTSGDITTAYLDYVTISATANYGYHFSHWNDYNYDNPRQVQVTEDKTYTAYFDKNTYYITKNYDSNQGYVNGSTSGEYLDNITLTAKANYGYHFVKWSDGNTDNPRSLELTQDTVLTAEFAPNNYTLSVQSDNSECGTTSGDITTTYLDYVTISATANYGYHFSHWNDYNYNNPRQVQVTEDKTYIAYFDKNTYYITKNYDSNQGYVNGSTSGEYLDNITLTAEANYGYHFVRWADGNTDNPRHFILTQDTTFSAEFAQTFSGQCGDNLYWSYQNNTLTISGFGGMYDNRPWGLFTNEIQTVVLPNGITHIGNDAFSDCTGLNAITIPYTVTSIGDYAFAGCRKLVHVNCYAINPPMAETTSFANYNVYLNVPCDNLQDYQLDMVFGSFKYIQCMEADSENVPTDDVVVTPGTNDVTITWPTAENADTYTIVIQKGNEVFCTLTFNADGQLLNIAFAPGRNGNNRTTQYATQTINGLRFTITGLNEGTHYTYDITAKDTEDNTLQSHSGEFTTQSNIPSSIDNTPSPITNCQKIIYNGQFLILRDGKTYNTMGAEIR